MIDALLYAVRDGIRAAGLGYDQATCDIMEDEEGRPEPRCGNFYASVHSGASRSDSDNQLDELYSFTVTLTMRITVPLDRVGDQQMAVGLPRVPLAQRLGWYAKADQLRVLLHMNWGFVVLTQQKPNSANDNLQAWSTGTVYGFVEPMRFSGMESPKAVYGEWFGGESGDVPEGLKGALSFDRCRRMQPQTQGQGPFT